MELLRDFRGLSKNDANLAGGKGASLGEMTQVGISVPSGFVILATTFERFLEETDLNVEVDSILDSVNHNEIHTVENASEKIKALILRAEMPKDIGEEIQKFFKDLNSKYVAVRSSATAEDSASAAWAGQLDSFLNTTEENLLENVKKCWASLFTPRAIFYRFEKDLHKQKISVAVVVQKMVESEVSGIAFSVHPITEDRNQLIIEAGFGLGEAIVSGQITPDSYVVEKETRRIIDKNVQIQSKAIYRAENGGNEWRNIQKEKAEKQVLSNDQILELSEMILQIENHYGFPCDIEWAFESGAFYIVQSRPITTLQKESLPENLIDTEDEWVFMWSTTALMPTYWATCQALLTRSDVYSNGEIFCYFDGHIITAYMQKSQINKFKKEGEKYLNINFLKKYQEQYDKETKGWWDWIRRIESTDYTGKPLQVLLQDYIKFTKYQRDSIAYFGSTRTEFTFAAEQRLEEIIKKYYEDEWPDIFGILTTATTLDNIQNEYIDWLKLLQNKQSDQDLLHHVSKYSWLVFGQFDDAKVIEFLKNRAGSEKGILEDESKRLMRVKQDLKKKHEVIINKFSSDASEGKYLAEFLRYQSVERMNIKAYWAGSYYLARKMWFKISDNMNQPLWDLIGYITPKEVQQIILGEYSDDIQSVINDRKKSHALVVSQGELVIVGSEDAKHLFQSRVKKAENKDNFIKGQTAMLGVANGKVRKVIAGDLDMLQNSIKDFKQGEILVTSMTQPNMMVLAQKSAAIITDEGGITSHAAIIARELRIPCIVGCLYAMQILNDGDEVVVNANKGEVEIINKVI